VLSVLVLTASSRIRSFDLVVDGLFGFSFRGAPRPPFDTLLRLLCSSAGGAPPVASIDIPSGASDGGSHVVRLACSC
jgi:NAD(P)H-hydrate epimerase